MLEVEIPELSWPPDRDNIPDTLTILDFIEFCYRRIAKPERGWWHDYHEHYHMSYDELSGKNEFRQDVNRMLSRNGLAYELTEEGRIERIAPTILREVLKEAVFHSGDALLDELLETARRKFLSPVRAVRRESLDQLWDAWERLKTLEPGTSKKLQIEALFKKAAPDDAFYEALNREGSELTDIGNRFQIRHAETTQIPLSSDDQVDYLFHRCFSMIRFLLKHTGRGG